MWHIDNKLNLRNCWSEYLQALSDSPSGNYPLSGPWGEPVRWKISLWRRAGSNHCSRISTLSRRFDESLFARSWKDLGVDETIWLQQRLRYVQILWFITYLINATVLGRAHGLFMRFFMRHDECWCLMILLKKQEKLRCTREKDCSAEGCLVWNQKCTD